MVKKILVLAIIVAAMGAGVFYYLTNEKFEDSKTVEADFSVDAKTFMQEYQTDFTKANEKYSDKMLAVKGEPSSVEVMDSLINVQFADSISNTYCVFSIANDKTNPPPQKGQAVTLKGNCSGAIKSEILGSTAITFKRAVILENK